MSVPKRALIPVVTAAVLLGAALTGCGEDKADDKGAGAPRTTAPTAAPSTPAAPAIASQPPAPTGAKPAGPGATAPTSPGRESSPGTRPPSVIDSAVTDRSPFTPETFFGAHGPRSIQGNKYTLVASDAIGCMPGSQERLERLTFDQGCKGIVRGTFVDEGTKHVSSVAVMSLPDRATAERVAANLKGASEGGGLAAFLAPPAVPGGPTLANPPKGTAGKYITQGHFLLLVEVAKADGGAVPANDAEANQVASNTMGTAVDHINTLIWGKP
ncbi:hypothetical protein [Embleya sp. NBC_00896]|uniref:hypothetical protein n=1 Tax=Embleya sp. NBC_00896 TaxID=2975961 RepID=UPI0038709FD4|nr:hypothetical protein OG928_07645 [Embleya sp. NBC_00896]